MSSSPHFTALPPMTDDEAKQLIVAIQHAYGFRGVTYTPTDVRRMAEDHLDGEVSDDELERLLALSKYAGLSERLTDAVYDDLSESIAAVLDDL